ncbi:hypothetical protein LINPERHAP2_LOCUS19116 [Linum perenne]
MFMRSSAAVSYGFTINLNSSDLNLVKLKPRPNSYQGLMLLCNLLFLVFCILSYCWSVMLYAVPCVLVIQW